jgi:hypothetical protein
LIEAFKRDGKMRLREGRRGDKCYIREGERGGKTRGGMRGFTRMKIYGDAESGFSNISDLWWRQGLIIGWWMSFAIEHLWRC